MRFIARTSRTHRRHLSPRHAALKLPYLLITRLALPFLLLPTLALLLLTTWGISPPPSALFHATGGRAQQLVDISQCGCHRADICTTVVPVGSFNAPHFTPLLHNLSPPARELEKRRRIIRSVTMTAWDQYVCHAWGFDELLPRSVRGANPLGGFAATIVEALGTLYIMRLSTRYEAARSWVDKHLQFDSVRTYVNVHEVTTRILGALLSAYQLTADDMYLRKAEDLGRRLAPAFNTPNGVPYPKCRLSHDMTYDLDVEPGTADDIAYDIESDEAELCVGMKTTQSAAGGLSLEFRALSFHSLHPDIRALRCKSDRAVQAVVEAGPRLLREQITEELLRRKAAKNVSDLSEHMDQGELDGGSQSIFGNVKLTSMDSYYAYMVELWHGAVSAVGAGPTVDNTATFSAPARGFYEYLIKAWRQGGSCESSLKYPLDASIHMLLRRAIYQAPSGDLYLRSLDNPNDDSQAVVEQAMCYLPAVFHLTSRFKDISARQEDQLLDVAEGITQSCLNMYRMFPTKLGGESARFNGKIWVTKGAYKLQADMLEALFYMWRGTHVESYRTEAWKTFLSIIRQCKMDSGAFTILEEQTVGNVTQGDRMPSQFIGSTLKFLYLLFGEDDILPLDNWVFNRGGHPLVVTPGLGALNPCNSDILR